MPSYWIAVIVGSVIISIVIGIKIYWSILLAMFPARERATEVHSVTTKDMWEIKLFRYRRGRTSGEPVFLLHGAGVNHKNFTEPEGACLVDELVARGFDVWALDTRVCRSSKPAFERKREDATLDDVLLQDIPAAIRYIRKTTSYGRVHWVGHSLGGMMLYAYLQHWGNDFLASGTTLGSPLGFVGTNIRIKRVPWPTRKYPHEMTNILRALIPLLYYTGIRTILFPINTRNLHPRLGPGNLFHVVEDPMPKAMDQLLQWASTRTWTMLDGKLDVLAGFKTMDLPLFTLFAPRDPFVPAATARPFFESLPNPDKRFAMLAKDAGCQNDYDHCDMAFGVDSPRAVFEPIARWIEAHPISERVRAEEIGEDDIVPRAALRQEQRAEILTGTSFAHVATKAPVATAPAPAVSAPAPKPEAIAPSEAHAPQEAIEIERIIEVPPAAKKATAKAPAKKPTAKAARATKPATPVKAKPTAKKPAAKAKAKPAPKPAEKPKAKAPEPKKSAPAPAKKAHTKPGPAKPTPLKKAPAKPETKPAAKPVAKPQPKPAPKPTPKPAPKPTANPAKSSATPRVTLAPTKNEKHKPSMLTKSALMAASEALKDLEKKK